MGWGCGGDAARAPMLHLSGAERSVPLDRGRPRPAPPALPAGTITRMDSPHAPLDPAEATTEAAAHAPVDVSDAAAEDSVEGSAPRRRGRPRSEASREAVLRAAAELMGPGQHARLTMEGIAARAGVSKQTVYRWWKTKVDVLVEAVGAGYLEIPLPSVPDTGDLRADLTHWLRAMQEEIDGGGATRLSQSLVGAIAAPGGQSRQIHGMLVAPVREQLHARFRAADLPADLDREMLAETVTAQLLMRVLFADPTDEVWIQRLVGLVASERR